MKNKPYINSEGYLVYNPWYSNGYMMYRRDCLDMDHPENLWNHLTSNGINPSHFNIPSPFEVYAEEFKDKTRIQLIEEIINLRKELEGALRYL